MEREQRNTYYYHCCHLTLDSLSMLFWLNIYVLFGLNLSITVFRFYLTSISFSIFICNQPSHFQCTFAELHVFTVYCYMYSTSSTQLLCYPFLFAFLTTVFLLTSTKTWH